MKGPSRSPGAWYIICVAINRPHLRCSDHFPMGPEIRVHWRSPARETFRSLLAKAFGEVEGTGRASLLLAVGDETVEVLTGDFLDPEVWQVLPPASHGGLLEAQGAMTLGVFRGFVDLEIILPVILQLGAALEDGGFSSRRSFWRSWRAVRASATVRAFSRRMRLVSLWPVLSSTITSRA